MHQALHWQHKTAKLGGKKKEKCRGRRRRLLGQEENYACCLAKIPQGNTRDLQPSPCSPAMQNINMLPKGAAWPQHTAVGTGWALLAAGQSQPWAASDPATAESQAQVGWGLAEVWYKNLQLCPFPFPTCLVGAAWVLVAECVLSKAGNWWAALVGCGWRGRRLKGLLNEWKHLKSLWLRAECGAKGWVKARSELSEGPRFQVSKSAVKDSLNKGEEKLGTLEEILSEKE